MSHSVEQPGTPACQDPAAWWTRPFTVFQTNLLPFQTVNPLLSDRPSGDLVGDAEWVAASVDGELVVDLPRLEQFEVLVIEGAAS